MPIQTRNRRRLRRARASVAALVATFSLAGCDSLLEVVDPDLVVPASITSSELFWAGAIGDFMDAVSSNGGMVVYGGLFTDEFLLSGTFPTRLEVDERNIKDTNGTMEGVYRDLHAARVGAQNAAELLADEFGTDSRIAEMNSFEGYTYLFFGETYCSGVPFGRSKIGAASEQGLPLTTTEMFQKAASLFDQATGNAAGSSTQLNLAAMGKARALLNMGQFNEAAAAAASVADDWEYLVRHHSLASGGDNGIYSQNVLQGRWSVSDQEGINGIDFRTANDPRLDVTLDPDEFGFDTITLLWRQHIYENENDDAPLTSGLEKRLIQAEAALNSGGDWLGILNDLRSAVPGLAPLADPGNQDDRVRMLFEERAWWLYAKGYRMGDLRRMIRQYGFSENEVFPTGPHPKGSDYSSDVTFPIPEDEETNPNYTACIDRNA